jgi:ATP-dependent Clp protease ATP-binding subunit ClpA
MERAAQLRSLLARTVSPGDPAARLRALAELRRELQAAETELVADAVRAEVSWSRIGAALGISKQAAHRRHSHGVARLDQAVETEHHGSQVRVAAEVRRAVRIARQEAAAAAKRSVGTEHLLLGLLQCGGRDAQALLAGLGVSLELAREAVQPTSELSLARATTGAPGNGMPPSSGASGAAVLSPLARRVLERALARRSRASGPLGALDLLDALLRDDRGGAARTLQSLGVEPAAARLELARAMA